MEVSFEMEIQNKRKNVKICNKKQFVLMLCSDNDPNQILYII